MKSNSWRNEDGAIAVMTALVLPMIIGLMGMGLDFGNLYVVRTRMQTAADAAVCGGGLKLPDQGLATTAARAFITNNNFNPDLATITFTQDAGINPSGLPEINCSLTTQVPTSFLGMFGYPTVPITVFAKGIAESGTGGSGPFNYALFSHKDLTVSGNTNITGSVHTNKNLTISGNTTITGAAEGATGVTVSGNSNIGSVVADTTPHIHISGHDTIGSEAGGATNIDMPNFTSQIEAIAQSQGTVYSRSTTLSGQNNINGNIWVQGNLTMSGGTTGTGAVLANGNITISGNTTIGGNGQVCLYSANGNITISGSLNSGSNGSAIIYAPNGKVTISGNATIKGGIIAKQIVISGNRTINGDYTVTSLPVSGANVHVKLIQ